MAQLLAVMAARISLILTQIAIWYNASEGVSTVIGFAGRGSSASHYFFISSIKYQ